MIAFVGLGNPGSQFEGTRHNIGFEVVDSLARAFITRFRAGKGEYYHASGEWSGQPLVLARPTTYMNNSGEAVAQVLEHYRLTPDQLLVICDDFQLPLGVLRLRQAGSDGGHNGLYSIIYHLGTLDFPRLRCGIGSPRMPREKSEMARFVLDVFGADEREAVNLMVSRAHEACLSVISQGLAKTMSMYNAASVQ